MPTPDYILQLRMAYGQGRLFLPGVSGVVIRNDLATTGQAHLLLTRRSDSGRWALPAGIVEPDEQPASTLVRELLEETRVLARAERLALVRTDPELTYPHGDVCQFLSLTFRCRYLSGEAQVGDDESTDVGWFAVDDLPAELTAEQRHRIDCALPPSGECRFEC